VISTYGVRELFRQALIECVDITDADFPHLSVNKKERKALGNVSKITRQAFRRLMIFVARVYYAHFIEEQLDSEANLGTFSFATYPVLKKMFQCIESHMREVAKPNPKSPAKAKSPVDVVITLQTQLNGLEKTSLTLEKGLRNARATCTVLLQKLKYLERGKAKAKTKLTTERDAIVAEVLAAVKETGKRKRKKHKKKKRHKKHRSS
jgi:hypothetical protein